MSDDKPEVGVFRYLGWDSDNDHEWRPGGVFRRFGAWIVVLDEPDHFVRVMAWEDGRFAIMEWRRELP